MEALAVTRQDAHRAANDAYIEAQRIIGEGKQAKISAVEHDDDLYLERLKYYWGVILKATSEQVPGNWDPDAFHAHFKRKFLGYIVEKEKVFGSRRIFVTRRLMGLRDLKNSGRKLAAFVQQVEAYVVADLGVTLPEQER